MKYQLGTKGDDIYREMLELFEGLTPKEREKLFAKLTLALLNEVGDAKKIRSIFEQIR